MDHVISRRFTFQAWRDLASEKANLFVENKEMTGKLPNVAVALFVKDEFSDIAGWIAWHAALGVRTFFIYDDHSTDGTWEILTAASHCHDIRLRRTDPASQPDFYQRQRDCFMEVAEECKGQFDWLGFLDGDEYVYLRHYDSLPKFFASVSHASGVAFSWRIYGSNDRVVRPRNLTVEAFTRHATEALDDNVLVKSFIRPEKMGNKYINPHIFDIPAEDYIRPSGKPVKGLIATQDIEWSDGFVMHFICRSMENYVQRIRRRLDADLSDSIGYWNHFNRNEMEDREPLRLIPCAERYLSRIYDNSVALAVKKLSQSLLNPGGDQFDATISQLNAPSTSRIFRLTTYFGGHLYYAPEKRTCVHASEEYARAHQLQPVYAIVRANTPQFVSLFMPTHPDVFVRLMSDHRLMTRLIYRVTPQIDGFATLSNPVNHYYMSYLPLTDGVGVVESNRHEVREWEYVKLTPFDKQDLTSDRDEASAPPPREISVSAMLGWLRQRDVLPDNDEFLRAFYQLGPSSRLELMRHVPGLLWNVT